jgi:hypothetical protein
MEIVQIVRVLLARRRAVAAGLVLAVALVVVKGPSPTASAGVVTARVALFTPKAQIVDAHQDTTDTLSWRAVIVADQLVSSTVQQEIAQEMGVGTEQLAIVDTSLAEPMVPASLPRAASDAATAADRPYLISVYADGIQPIITLSVLAPDSSRALRLTQAAVGALQRTAPVTGGKGVSRFSVDSVTPPVAKAVTVGGGWMTSAGLGLTFLVLWTIGVVLSPAVGRWWRSTGRAADAEVPAASAR